MSLSKIYKKQLDKAISTNNTALLVLVYNMIWENYIQLTIYLN